MYERRHPSTHLTSRPIPSLRAKRGNLNIPSTPMPSSYPHDPDHQSNKLYFWKNHQQYGDKGATNIFSGLICPWIVFQELIGFE